MKLTKQGLRDLGNNGRRRSTVVVVCPHVWDEFDDYDCMDMTRRRYQRCGFCGVTR